ncbi:MAG: hypothetical protein IANPNBLG_00483 [Bryobacteraceae bacterium]|nr:hypothetical protein [Bryobacteraceae bacterium]
MDKVRHPQVIRSWKVERTKILTPRPGPTAKPGPVPRKAPARGK